MKSLKRTQDLYGGVTKDVKLIRRETMRPTNKIGLQCREKKKKLIRVDRERGMGRWCKTGWSDIYREYTDQWMRGLCRADRGALCGGEQSPCVSQRIPPPPASYS